MNIPTLPTGRNKYYDLGPTRQFDVDVIRRALLQYENTMKAEVEAAEPDSDERYHLAAERIAWTRSNDTVEHRGVVDEFYPQNGAEDAYLAVIEPGRYIPVLGASEIQKISILEDKHRDV